MQSTGVNGAGGTVLIARSGGTSAHTCIQLVLARSSAEEVLLMLIEGAVCHGRLSRPPA